MLFLVLGPLAVLIVAAGVIDFRARRRGLRYTGVDAKKAGDDRRRNEADLRSRSNDLGYGNPGGGVNGAF